MLRRSLVTMLMLLGALAGSAGNVCAQSNPAPPANMPRPAPAGLDAAALPLPLDGQFATNNPTTARRTIAHSMSIHVEDEPVVRTHVHNRARRLAPELE